MHTTWGLASILMSLHKRLDPALRVRFLESCNSDLYVLTKPHARYKNNLTMMPSNAFTTTIQIHNLDLQRGTHLEPRLLATSSRSLSGLPFHHLNSRHKP